MKWKRFVAGLGLYGVLATVLMLTFYIHEQLWNLMTAWPNRVVIIATAFTFLVLAGIAGQLVWEAYG